MSASPLAQKIAALPLEERISLLEELGEGATRAFLDSHGILVAPQVLDSMVREAIARLPQTLYRVDPREDLTEAEAAALESGGFVLEPADFGSEDPLARTTAEYAALLKASLSTNALAERLGVDSSRI